MRVFTWTYSVTSEWVRYISTLADLRWGGGGVPSGPISFIFMQIWHKFCQIRSFRPKLMGWPPPSGKSWICHWSMRLFTRETVLSQSLSHRVNGSPDTYSSSLVQLAQNVMLMQPHLSRGLAILPRDLPHRIQLLASWTFRYGWVKVEKRRKIKMFD